MFSRCAIQTLFLVLVACGLIVIAESPARSESLLLVEADTGKVLHAANATYPWYPASITKIMTTYATLHAVKEGRLTLDTLLTVSQKAAAERPAKRGSPSAPTSTVQNALQRQI